MDLLQLHYFRTVARFEHVTRAAEELRVAQPALSKTLARLEAELGVPLFDRRQSTSDQSGKDGGRGISGQARPERHSSVFRCSREFSRGAPVQAGIISPRIRGFL